RLPPNYTGEGHGILSISGLRATLRCQAGAASPELELLGANAPPIRDEGKYRIVTTDFLATGGDGFARALGEIRTSVRILWERPAIHDFLAEQIAQRGGTLHLAEVYNRAAPRIGQVGCIRPH